jgi:hypothetical protein
MPKSRGATKAEVSGVVQIQEYFFNLQGLAVNGGTLVACLNVLSPLDAFILPRSSRFLQ